ncbi:hypothetical protein [Piscinibacter sp. XHJ-5]|uniref:hypothetical protein n=1 Tax=Piscinibacter sp. XHJ-5 TaxID=3037797 RepID=UPI0024535624|nr:hypothetical protein [Piscinibacter sp. XHJ-5]
MNKVPNIPWWSSMGLRKPEPVPDTDYADMGTAFGLDASLSPREEPLPAEPGDAGPATDRLNRRSVI